jgi:hypothetical protein
MGWRSACIRMNRAQYSRMFSQGYINESLRLAVSSSALSCLTPVHRTEVAAALIQCQTTQEHPKRYVVSPPPVTPLQLKQRLAPQFRPLALRRELV